MAAVCIAGQNGSNTDGGDGYTITLTDSLGNENTYTFSEKLSRICVVSSNAMEWVQLLGMQDMVVSGCHLALTEDTLDASKFANAKDVGEVASASVEDIAQSKAQLVVNVDGRNGLSTAKLKELKETYSIPSISLNCYGESMMNDAAMLVKIADSSSVQARYDSYVTDRNTVLEKVRAAVNSQDETVNIVLPTVHSSAIQFYLGTSEMGKILKNLKTNNVIDTINPSTNTSTIYLKASVEAVVEMDSNEETQIDFALVRTMAGTSVNYDLEKVFEEYKKYYVDGSQGDYYDSMNSVVKKQVLSYEADITSGCMDYIGQVLFCHLLGYDIDAYAGDLVDQFQEKYGFKGTYEYLAYDGTTYYSYRSASA